MGCDQKSDSNEVEEIVQVLGQRDFGWILAPELTSTVILGALY